MGPILGDLETQLHINLDVVSYLYFAQAVGFMLGAITGGKLYNHYPKQAHNGFGGAMITGAIAFCCLPFVTSPFWLYCCDIFIGWSAGQNCTIGNLCMLALFDSQINDKTGSSESGPYMQFLHFTWAIGPLVCPLLIQLSITITSTYHAAIYFMVALMIPIAIILFILPSPTRSNQNNDDTSEGNHTEFDVLLAKNASYGSVPMFTDEKGLKTKLKVYSWAMVITFASVLSMYCGAEWSYGAYTTLFGLHYLDMSALWSRMLCSAFWFGFTGGRLLGVWVALHVRTETILLINLVGSALSMAVLAIVIYFTTWNAMYWSWVLSVSYGLFMASTYPAMVTILEETVVVTGDYAMLLLLGTGVGVGIVPMAVGHIMYRFGMNAFVLTSFVMTMSVAVIYLISNIFRFKINQIKKYVKFKKGKTSSLMQLF
eukprot:1122756_1